MNQILTSLWNKNVADSRASILSSLESSPNVTLLDCGCDDGQFTLEIAKKIGTKNIFGIEIVEEKAKRAELRRVKVLVNDLNENFPFYSESVDVITANQLIEHLYEPEGLSVKFIVC